ncbi:phosphatidylglycerol/phosphatidylinositol transfer protein-like [Miscanthus floridulus]|uniref:phosphatidylglycerol/phosphatidylinositol transfer protein-like n=1 Tax=Miscanthus floridulus TaxID=154761 RepID=UPI0034587F1E
MASKQTRLVLLPAAVAACLLLLPAASVATDVDYCSKKDYPVKVSGVQIVPDPVEPGKPATFKISASTDKTIEKGKLQIDVKYFFFYVHSETRDICGETSCPATGDFMLSHEQTLPGFTPPGSYTIYMKIVGDDNEELSCISFGFSIGFVASS